MGCDKEILRVPYKSEVDPKEDWRVIPGHSKYKCNAAGQVVRVWKTGNTTQLQGSFIKKRNQSARFQYKLVDDSGVPHQRSAMLIILHAFGFEVPKDLVPVHINGVKTDNALANIGFMRRADVGNQFGPSSRRRPVKKVDADGNDVAYYSSVREAGRMNYLSYQSVADCCNGKTKRGICPDGYRYEYDDLEEREWVERMKKRRQKK